MSKLDFSQYTKRNLVKVSTGETVGFAFIRKGEAVERLDDLQVVEVDEENNALASSGYISQAEETGDQIVKEEPKQEESANISNIFLGDSSDDMSKDESTSKCKMDPPVKIEAKESTAVLLSSLADQILRSSGRESYDKGTESNLANVKSEVEGRPVTDQDLERELDASGVRQGKKDLDKPGAVGWLREVVLTKKGYVVSANYVTPPHPVTGARKRLKRQKDIVNFLEATGNKDLSFRNFNLNQRIIGLKPEFEMIRTSMSSRSTDTTPQRSLFAGYFRDLPMDPTSEVVDYASRKVTECFRFQILRENKVVTGLCP